MVERIKMLTKEERIEKIKEANYNLFNLKAEDVYIDLLTDSGTNAMSDYQWAGVLRGDEAYAGGKKLFNLVENAQDIFNYKFIQPVHQGEQQKSPVSYNAFTRKGSYIKYVFDTTEHMLN